MFNTKFDMIINSKFIPRKIILKQCGFIKEGIKCQNL